MKQTSFGETGLGMSSRRARKQAFLEEMNRVVPWANLRALIASHAPGAKTGRPPFTIETMYDMPRFRQFVKLKVDSECLPDESPRF